MKVFLLIFCGLSFALFCGAQTNESSKKEETRVTARPAGDIVPLPSIKALSAAQAAGKKLFVQRCSVCHLPALPSYTAYGPLLDKNLVEDRGEEAIRLQVMQGSARMPGFQYTLSPVEIDQIAGYLKTLDLAKKD
jgi:mono/diheme cytochrome c family protein